LEVQAEQSSSNPLKAEEFELQTPSTTDADYQFYAICVHTANRKEKK
jgi:hypothetical protein